MKKSVMTLVGCALIAGVSVAAEVVGNNTAVVIQKEANQSPSGYQFLCIPVSGFDITGAANKLKTIPLADLFPTATYTDGSFLIVESVPELSEGQSYVSTGTTDVDVVSAGTMYEVANGVWQKQSAGSASNFEIAPGTIVWLNKVQAKVVDPAEPAVQAEGDAETTIFCGEGIAADGTRIVAANGTGMVAYGNITSAAMSIADIVLENPGYGDFIYVTQNNTDEYKQYKYFYEDGWHKMNNGWEDINAATEMIPAGEAFYYYHKVQVQK